MPDDFDAYFKWLGIPPEEQPPNHYRLLSIPLFVDDATVIENAADQRMAHLRSFQTGKHSALSQRLLNEVAAARVCLLNPKKKAAYDDQLRQALQAQQAAGADVAGVEIDLGPAPTGVSRTPSAKPAVPPMAWIAGGGVAGLVLLGLVAWSLMPRGHSDGRRSSAEDVRQDSKKDFRSPVPSKPVESKKGDWASAVQDPPQHEKETPASPQATPQPAQASPPSPSLPTGRGTSSEDNAASETPLPDAKPVKPTAENALPSPSKPTEKIPPPSIDEQKPLITTINEVYKTAEAKDAVAKTAVAQRLLDDGRKNEANRPEQFVMLRRASELARDAGDIKLMLAGVDAMADAGFNIPSWKTKARLLKPAFQGDAPDAKTLSAIAASCVQLAEEVRGDASEDAAGLLDAAGDGLTKAKKRAQSEAGAARVAARRARTPADKAEREKKAQEAEGVVASLDEAVAAVAGAVKGLQQSRRDQEAFRAARKRLETDPDDAEACLAVGRWLCFREGDWDEGLKLLAKGSDETLKSLASGDLAAKPTSAADRAARGDAWWDAAEKKSKGGGRAALRVRAGLWYQEALPDLSGLNKTRVEGRLTQAAADEPEGGGASTRLRPPLAIAPFDEKTAKKHQARWAKYLGVPVEFTNSIGMKFVLIPPGEFEMGSPREFVETASRSAAGNYGEGLVGELPQHRVRITKPFWLGATEVTQEQYLQIMGTNAGKATGQETGRYPAVVSWEEASRFCGRLTARPEERKQVYELPTEAQWEHACRAGTQTLWFFGDDKTRLAEYGWGGENSGLRLHAVGEKKGNPWGLYDVYGNAWEWCQDWYSEHYYASSPVEDPTGPAAGSRRVLRGCCSKWGFEGCRSALRHGRSPQHNEFDMGIGFRVSLVIEKLGMTPLKSSAKGSGGT